MATLSSDSRPIISHGPSLLARLFLLGLVSIGIMVLDHKQKYLDVARDWLSAGVYPLQVLVQTPFQAWHWVIGTFADRDRLTRENLEMRAQLRVANLQLLRYASLAEENRQLRNVRDAADSLAPIQNKDNDLPPRTLIAEIMRVDMDPYRHRVLLNHGANDNLYKGQAVLDASGVFGQITRVGRFAAEAILITDAAHATPVRLNRTGLRSIAVGTGDFNKLTLPYITGDADIKIGDLLVTSGLGGIFPPGYPVATVSVVKRNPAETFATVEAKPLAQMDRARVLMLTWFDAPTTLDIDTPANSKQKSSAKTTPKSAAPPANGNAASPPPGKPETKPASNKTDNAQPVAETKPSKPEAGQ